MKDFQKLLYSREGSTLELAFDIEKLEGSKRVVVGFATLDNIDFGSDIVAANASEKAFSNFRGNVRLQHDKGRPVGRVLSFKKETIFDPNSGKTYNGIKVAVYISEGAEDVWKMCQDGTLSGFSIGGAVLSASKIYNEDIDKTVQVIDEYALLELSLVDSPMNGLANVVSIHKSLDGGVLEKDYSIQNLFYCGTDKLASKSYDSEAFCPVCSEKMVNFGQTNENEEISKSLEKVFEELKIETKGGHPTVKDTINKSVEGNEEELVDVVDTEVDSADEAPSEEVVNEVEELDAEPADAEEITDEVEEVNEVDAEAAADAEADAPVEEAEVSDTDTAEMLASLRELLEEASTATAKSHDELKDQIKSVSANLEKKFTDLEGKYSALEKTTGDIKEKLNSASEDIEETKKQLDRVVESTPIKKSLDSAPMHVTEKKKDEGVFKGLWSSDFPV